MKNKGYSETYVKKSIILLGYNCQVCGADKDVYLHHKDENPRNNNPTNWSRLCRSCHTKHHWVKRRIPELSYFKPGSAEYQRKYRKLFHINKIKPPIGYCTSMEKSIQLGITRQRLHQLIQKGRIKYKVIGNRIYLHKKSRIKPLTY